MFISNDLYEIWELVDWEDVPKSIEYIRKNFDLNKEDKFGLTYLLKLAANGWYEFFDILVTAGADPKQKMKYGITAFHFALGGAVARTWKHWSPIQVKGCRKILKLYFSNNLLKPAEIAVYAIALNRIGVFRETLKNGLDVDSRVPDAKHIFDDFTTGEAISRILKEHAGNIIETSTYHPTLLMWSIALNRTKLTQLLIENGADETMLDSRGMTCHDYKKYQSDTCARV